MKIMEIDEGLSLLCSQFLLLNLLLMPVGDFSF